MSKQTQRTTAEISSDTDTTLVPAPGGGQVTRISQIAIGVNDAGTDAAIEFEDGASGDILFSYLAAAGGDVFRFDPHLELSENTLLNAATKGAATWNITVWHQG